jgi:hypothetical protein
MSEMITRRCYDEMEVASYLLSIALGNYSLKSSSGPLEGGTRYCGVALELSQA